MTPPIPNRIHSALIKHNLDLQRYSSGLQLRIEAILDQLGKDLAHELMDAGLETTRTAWKTARLRALINAAGNRIGQTYQGIQELTGAELSELVSITGAGVTTAINDAIGAKILVAPKWTGEQLASIAGDALIRGAPSAEWWSRQSVGFRQAFADSMRQGMLRGETITEMRDRILPKVDLRRIAPESRPLIWTARRNAEALVRTSVMAVANDAHMAAYAANSDIIASLQWVATLDPRVCISCGQQDLQTWEMGQNHIIPPLHWGCRCGITVITKSWEQLAREAHGNSTLAKELDKIPIGDRASMNGPVSGDTSFESWFGSQDRTWQEEYLGPGRMRLYESGKLGLSDMTDGKGSPYTLKQLAAR